MPTPSHVSAPARSEAGFTLIELLVCMLIIAILSTMAMAMGLGSRKSANTTRVTAAATVYADAVEHFATDSYGLYPRPIGTTGGGDPDWSNASAAARWRGPQSVTARNNGFYVRTVPESVESGHTAICGGVQGAIPTCNPGTDGAIRYVPSTNRAGFQILVMDYRGQPVCQITSRTTGTPVVDPATAGVQQCTQG